MGIIPALWEFQEKRKRQKSIFKAIMTGSFQAWDRSGRPDPRGSRDPKEVEPE